MTDKAEGRPDFASKLLHSVGHFRGKARLADYLGRAVLKLDHRAGNFALASGNVVKIDLEDRIQRLMWGAAYEPHVKRCLSVLLRPGDIFVDVGAHIGYFSLVAGCLVGPTGKVFEFEADSEVFQRLQSSGSQFSWLISYPKVVWQRTKQVSFSNPHQPGESGWGKVAEVQNDGNVVMVESISLDDWHESVDHVPVRLLKIDAEGSEPSILDGARKLLSGARPYIIAELNDELLRGTGHSQMSVFGMLGCLGYAAFTMTSKGIIELPTGDMPLRPEVLFVPSERLQEAEQLFRS